MQFFTQHVLNFPSAMDVLDFPSAMDVFHETNDPDVVIWNNILTACVQNQHL